MDEPEEIVARRWRFHLMGAVESIAETKELRDLQDTELILGFFDCVNDDGLAYGDRALTDEERAVVKNVFDALRGICDDALAVKRRSVFGRVAHGLEPKDLIALGWFESVQPQARRGFDTFSIRGWMDEGLWAD